MQKKNERSGDEEKEEEGEEEQLDRGYQGSGEKQNGMFNRIELIFIVVF